MAESKEKKLLTWQNGVNVGFLALVALVVAGALNPEDAADQVGDGVSGALKRQLAEAAAENKALAAQNAVLEKQNDAFEKQIAALDKKYEALEKRLEELKSAPADRFDDYRDDPRGDYRRRPPYMDDRYYGRRPAFYNPSRGDYWYGAGDPRYYPVEYGRPQYGPYRYPWWDDRYSYGPQQPYYGGRPGYGYGYGGQPQYPYGGPRGGGALRIGASFPIGDNGRLSVGATFPFGRRYY